MHAPRPYGLFVDGGELTERDKTFISHQMRKLTNTIQTEEVTNYRHEYELPDGGYVIVQDMGGIFKAIARKKEKFEKFEPDGFARLYVPMLFSGMVTRAVVRKGDDGALGQGVKITISEQTRRRLANYSTQNMPNKYLELQRFIVEINKIVGEFFSQIKSDRIITTQYDKQRPTWYSGAMAEVMQIVGGYGRQDFNNLPDNAVERARIIIPEKYLIGIAEKLKGFRLPAYSGIPPITGQYSYDYKFNNTNGVSFDKNNKPWLIRIRNDGVYAAPLPIVPATTTSEFKDYITENDDQELLDIINRFGGMPSGEPFPSGDAFHAWRRAGVVIKVCDTADFYTGIPYSDACGWSFNTRGTEGFNTAWYFNQEGIIVGDAYKMQLNLGAANAQGWLRTTWEFTTAQDSAAVNNYLQELFKIFNTTKDNELAIRYKIGRQTTSQILSRAIANPVMDRKEVLYWDNLELDPIASHSGRVTKVSSGFLYHNNKPKNQPQIKFPDVLQQGCVSFDFSPIDPIEPSRRPNCDTIMYGYYVGDSLKVVKYFVDWRSYQVKAAGNFEPVMTVGAWEQTTTTGGSYPTGYFYTSDLDFREVFTPFVSSVKIVGEDRGFDSKPFFEFAAIFSMRGALWRNRYYSHFTTSIQTENSALKIGVCVPFFCRNAVLLATEKLVNAEKTTEVVSLLEMRDPTSYEYWTFDFVFAWRDPLRKQTGKPTPIDGSPVWVEIENYNPTPYSDFADQGSWLPNLPYDISWLIRPETAVYQFSGGGGRPTVKEYLIEKSAPQELTGSLHASINENASVVKNTPVNGGYFEISPDDFGFVFYRDGCRVVFGDIEYANISELGNNNLRKSWGYTRLADHKSAHHFIGVINE